MSATPSDPAPLRLDSVAPPRPVAVALLALLESIGSLLAVTGLALALMLGYLGWRGVSMTAEPTTELLRELPTLLALQAGVLVLGGAWLIRMRVGQRRGSPEVRLARAIGWGLGGAATAFALSYSLAFVLEALGLPVEEQPLILAALEDPATRRRVIPMFVLVAPIAEEVFFRGYMLRFLEERSRPTAAIVATSVLFAVTHLNPAGMPVYLAIGVVLAVIYRRAGTLVAPIVAHVCFNALVLAMHLASR